MPTASCELVNEYEVVTTLCCTGKSVVVETKFTVSIDGKALISGKLQFNVGNGTPNIENVARATGADATYKRAAFLLTYYMLRHVEATKFKTVRVAAAHAGVLALTRAGFTQKTNHDAKAAKLAGQELECNDIAAAKQLCLDLFRENNAGVTVS
jgi:hypothetical protein